MWPPRWLRLSLALPLLVLNLFVLRQLLLPLAPFPALFVAAALIAFLLDLPSRWLQQRGLTKPLSFALVLGITLGGLSLAATWLVPRLIEQLGELVNAIPSWLVQAQELLNQLQSLAEARGWPTDFSPLSDDLLARSSRVARSVSQQLLSLLSATLGLTVNTVIVLVLAIFLLLGGESIAAGLARWIPSDWRELIFSTINRTFRGYFAGQVLIALILSGLQLVVFTLLQIPYG
ncbi:AI-2E family transporter, partial [Synechococcus sp. UW140]